MFCGAAGLLFVGLWVCTRAEGLALGAPSRAGVAGVGCGALMGLGAEAGAVRGWEGAAEFGTACVGGEDLCFTRVEAAELALEEATM